MSRHSVLCRDNGARRCVTTRRDACATEVTTSYSGKKKKKGHPQNLGCHIACPKKSSENFSGSGGDLMTTEDSKDEGGVAGVRYDH